MVAEWLLVDDSVAPLSVGVLLGLPDMLLVPLLGDGLPLPETEVVAERLFEKDFVSPVSVLERLSDAVPDFVLLSERLWLTDAELL